jgi:hypothetical protein
MGVDVPVVDKPGYGRLRRRRIILLVIVALAVVASSGALLLSSSIKSPAQQAAEIKSPGLTRLTAPVQDTVIRNTVQASGVITKPAQISSLGSGGGGGGSVGGNAQQVVTKIFRAPGSYVSPGNVIIEVAGQPFFVFQGKVPAYRDMAPGESGTDIAELQAGLESLGFGIGADPSGVYGRGTAAAIAAFYLSLGYTAPTVKLGPKAHGAEVPLSAIMFVPRFPARVVKLGGKVGSIVSGPLVTLTMGTPQIKGQLNPAYGALVRPGMHVTITVQGSPAVVHGIIGSVTRKAQTSGSISGGLYYPMRIKLRKPLPPSMGPGQDVIVSIRAAQSNGAMLAVPEAALFAGQDGKDYVSKVTGANSATRVPVMVVTTGDGLVGVRPSPPGALKPGDQVVTGENYLTSPLRGGGTLQQGSGRSGQFSVPAP